MHLSKARYVAFCQQLLACACVLAMGTAAAGVLTLDIVGPAPDERNVVPAVTEGDAYVATKPVAPKIREVAVKGVATSTPGQARNQKQAARKTGPNAPGLQVVALSRPERVSGLATVGVTWAKRDHFGEDQIRVDVRSLDKGTWSAWSKLEYHDDHGPDAGSADSRHERAGTEPVVVGHVQQVQMRTATLNGKAPEGLRLALIDPGADKVRRAGPAINTAKLPSNTDQQPTSSGSIALSAMDVAPKPQIYSRAQWGADERIRESGNPQYGTVKTGFVHHTVNANSYTKEQVPALIRGIYAYHVESKGWRDIGYNFLVDRFGRIWEGRFGGVDKAVVGAHTLGYNEVSFAMSSIGNFDVVAPPQAILDAYASLFAWKLSKYGIKADATHIYVKDRYLNAINGHRDTGQTACPGRYLYAKIPAIRAAAAKIQTQGGTPTPTATPTATPTSPPAGPAITPQPASALPARSNVTGSTWPDLIVRRHGTDEVMVVPTGGQTGFKAPVQATGSWGSYDLLVGAGDLTGDGKGDLFVRDRKTHVSSILPGSGTGTFKPAVGRTSTFANYRWVTGVGDYNVDGKPDLVGRDDHSRVLLFPGNGRSGFGKPVVLSSKWGYHRAYGIGDFNRDGNPDLVARSADSKLWLLRGARTKLGTATLLPVSLSKAGGIVAGDFTGDGVGDVMIRRSDTNLTDLFPGTGTGSVAHALGPFPVLRGLGRPSGANLIGTSGAEAIGINGDGKLAVATGNGRSNVGAPIDSGDALPAAGQVLNLGDWNRDGHSDLGSRPKGSDNLWFRAGDGRGHWGSMTQMGKGFKDITRLAAVGDITGDGDPDLVGKSGRGLMTIFPGNGKTGLKAAFRAPRKLRSFNQIRTGLWNATATGSTIASSDGSFVPYVGTDAGTAMSRTGVAGSYDWVIGPGDVDGDRVPDLIVREKASGVLWLLPGTGTGFGQRRFIASGFENYDLGG